MIGAGRPRVLGTAALLVAAAAGAFVAGAPSADAVHFYRGPGAGCSPASGNLTDDDSSPAESDATVLMAHNSYHDNHTGAPTTVVEPGDTVTWMWNSEHCHSVTGDGFESGFHFPAEEPSTPELAPGLFAYPVPELDDPALTFSHTFEEEGVYTYACVHHGAIGMVGTVIVTSG